MLKDITVDTKSFSDLPIMMFVARNMTSFWDLNSRCLTQLLEHTGFAVQDLQKWGKRRLGRAEGISDPVIDRTNATARGSVKHG